MHQPPISISSVSFPQLLQAALIFPVLLSEKNLIKQPKKFSILFENVSVVPQLQLIRMIGLPYKGKIRCLG